MNKETDGLCNHCGETAGTYDSRGRRCLSKHRHRGVTCEVFGIASVGRFTSLRAPMIPRLKTPGAVPKDLEEPVQRWRNLVASRPDGDPDRMDAEAMLVLGGFFDVEQLPVMARPTGTADE